MVHNINLQIRQEIESYSGPHAKVIKKFPEIFDLVISILQDPDLDRSIRHGLLASLGYILLPNDLHPVEELGPIGYIDDYLGVLHMIREVRNHYSEEYLVGFWQGEKESLRKILDSDFKQLISDYADLYQELLNLMDF